MMKCCPDSDLGINFQIWVNIFIFSPLKVSIRAVLWCVTSVALTWSLFERVPLFSNAALLPLKSAERRAVEPCKEMWPKAGGIYKESPVDFSRLWSELVKGCWQGALWCPHSVLISSLCCSQIVWTYWPLVHAAHLLFFTREAKLGTSFAGELSEKWLQLLICLTCWLRSMLADPSIARYCWRLFSMGVLCSCAGGVWYTPSCVPSLRILSSREQSQWHFMSQKQHVNIKKGFTALFSVFLSPGT